MCCFLVTNGGILQILFQRERILANWSAYSYDLGTKEKKMVFCCNTAWQMHVLDSEERQPLNEVFELLYSLTAWTVLSKIR